MAESYLNIHTFPSPLQSIRHWVHPQILVGGNINDEQDWKSLQHRHNIQSVINSDSRSEFHFSIPRLCEVPIDDDGTPFEKGLVRHAVSFAKVQVGIGNIYVHCHMGISRSPAFAYGILRWAFEMSDKDSLAAINSSGGAYGTDYLKYRKEHKIYLDSIEAALRP